MAKYRARQWVLGFLDSEWQKLPLHNQQELLGRMARVTKNTERLALDAKYRELEDL